MSVMDSKGGLSKATKELFARWESVRDIWSDAQSREFEKTFLEPIEQDVRSALGALDHLNLVIHSIHNDCE
jgi:hypothetical protein